MHKDLEGQIVGGAAGPADHGVAPGPGGGQHVQAGLPHEVQGDHADVERGCSVQTV